MFAGLRWTAFTAAEAQTEAQGQDDVAGGYHRREKSYRLPKQDASLAKADDARVAFHTVEVNEETTVV